MSGNRVEELEETVRELEATVEGLTDELIETKERLAAIEDETGVEPEPIQRASEEPAVGSEGTPDAAEAAPDSEEASDEETTDTAGDDIIVA
jgi:peptidoglycan hydrolase CwlO-like protein